MYQQADEIDVAPQHYCISDLFQSKISDVLVIRNGSKVSISTYSHTYLVMKKMLVTHT